MIPPGRWTRIQGTFEVGMGRRPEEREKLILDHRLDQETAENLRELWAHSDPPSGFLRAPDFRSRPGPPPVNLDRRLSPGDVIAGRFTVLSFIGAGGMGEVYRARDERLQRIVALKLLAPGLAADEQHRRLFEEEARSVSSLAHSRICTLHDFGADGDCLFLVMEFVEGETLEARLRRGRLSEQAAVEIATQVVEGLRAAHDNGLIHRDLKPSNIMIGRNGVKLLDFGIAKRTVNAECGESVEPASRLTVTGVNVGTPAYMSPEQAAGGKVDARSDIYSLGVVLREAVTGRRDIQVPEAPRPATSQKPNALTGIIARCLRPNPDERFRNALELERELRNWQVERAGTVWRRKIGQWAAIGAATLGVIGVAVFLSRRGEPAGPEPRLRALTAYPGVEWAPTLSPDGKSVAFLWDPEEKNIDVYTLSIGADKPVRLTDDPVDKRWPQWSPDGRWIAFTRRDSIFLKSPNGGAEKFLTKMMTHLETECDNVYAWAGDSKHIFFNSRRPDPGTGPIQSISIDTGAVQQLSHPEVGSLGDTCPVVSPDGAKVVFLHRTFDKRSVYRSGILDGSLALRNERDLPWVKERVYAWANNSREVIQSAPTPAGYFLFRTNIEQESAPRQLQFGEEGIYPAVARQGARMVYMRRKRQMDVVTFTLDGPGGIATPTKFSSSSQIDANAELSPDGRKLLFLSDRGGQMELWVADSNGENPQRPVRDVPVGDIPHWSPDGSRIVLRSDGVIKTVDPQTGRVDTIVPSSESARLPSYSRDGKWIYYSVQKGAVERIFKSPAGGGSGSEISGLQGYSPLESFDGRHLFFLQKNQGKRELYVASVTGEDIRKIAPVSFVLSLCVTDRGIYYLDFGPSQEPPSIMLYDPRTSKSQRVAQLPTRRNGLGPGLSVSSDHRRFLYSTTDMEGDLMLVENFR